MNLTELRADFFQLLDDVLADTVVVDDVRNVNPPCVLVGLPTIDWATHAVTQMVHVIAPAGASDDVDWMLDTLTAITAGPLGNRYRPTTAGPGTYGVSVDRLYPAYEITYRIPQPATFCLAVSPPVPPAPRVTLTVDDVTDLTVTVSVGNTDPDGPPASVDWGDGFETTDFTHTYDEPGTYRVTGRQSGRRDSIPKIVTVAAAPVPQLGLEVVDQSDLTVTVDVHNDDPELPVSIDYGDGTIVADTLVHTYDAAGTYTLIAEQVGRTDSTPVDVTVTEPPPPPQLVLTVDTVDDLEVTVTVANDDINAVAATVDWADGTIDALRTHTYAAAGTYTLIAEQPGRTDSDPVDVTVTEPAPPPIFATWTPAYYGWTGTGYLLNHLVTDKPSSPDVLVVLYGPDKVPLPTLTAAAGDELTPAAVGLSWTEINAAVGSTAQVDVSSPIDVSGPPTAWGAAGDPVPWLYHNHFGLPWGEPSFVVELLDAGGATVHTYDPITLTTGA